MSETTKKNELKKSLGFWDVMGLGIGQTIGSGIMVLTGIAIDITGAGVPFAFVLAALWVMCPATVISALGSAVPSTGGLYTYVRDYIGKKTGFYYLSLLVAGQLVLSMFAVTFAEYAMGVIPGLNATVVSVGILTICYIANIIGVDVAAKFQGFLVIVLIIAMALFAIYGLPQVDYSVFSQPNAIMPNGLMAFLTAASLLTFATSGSEFLSELGGEMKNPGKDLPRGVIYSVIIVALVYAFLGVVAVGVLPLEEVAGQNLVAVAQAVLPAPLAVFFIIGGGCFAVASTLNGTFSWCTKGLLVAAEEGWLPASIAKVGKKGTPVVLLTIFYIIGLVPIITGVSIRTIAMLGNGVSLIYLMFPIAAAFFVHEKNPEAMANAQFKISKNTLKVMTVISIGLYGLAAYLNFADIASSWMLIVGYSAIVLVYATLRFKHVKK